eukprot:scpid112607/ scgid11386/ 
MNDEANWPTQRQSLSCQPVAHSHTTPPYPLNTYTNVTVACAFSQHLPPQNSHLTHGEADWAFTPFRAVLRPMLLYFDLAFDVEELSRLSQTSTEPPECNRPGIHLNLSSLW